jgi:hypothetical protein
MVLIYNVKSIIAFQIYYAIAIVEFIFARY